MSEIENIDIVSPIQWSEGMMLAPQHFQQDQIYYERLLRHQIAQSCPYFWGLYSLSVDRSELSQGHIVIKTIHAVMPDGLIVRYDSEKSKSKKQLEFDLTKDENTKELDKNIMVHLAVPVRSDGAASQNSNIQRFSSWEDFDVSDENTGSNTLTVNRLEAMLEIKVGEDVSEKYSSIPLFKLRKSSIYKLEHYLPPVLAVNTKPFIEILSLGALLQATIRSVRKKAIELTSFCQSNQDGASVLGQNYRQKIIQLTQSLPPVEVLLNSERGHPFELYQAMAQLMASITPLSETLIPIELPPYQHNDYLQGFKKVINFIGTTLEGIKLEYSWKLFERDSLGKFSIQLTPASKENKILIELRPREGVSEMELQEWMRHVHIASETKNEDLQYSRTAGCKKILINRDEDYGIVAESGAALFEIEKNEKLIDYEQPLLLVCLNREVNKFEPSEIVLYIPYDKQGDESNNIDISKKSEKDMK